MTDMTAADYRDRARRDLEAAARLDGAGRQLTREDLKGMTPAEIVAAQEAGQLNELLGRTEAA